MDSLLWSSPLINFAVGNAMTPVVVRGLHLLYALTQADHGVAADLLARYGSSAAIVKGELENAL